MKRTIGSDRMRLWPICLAIALLLVFIGVVWLAPAYEEHRWQQNAESIREGMRIEEVVAKLGSDFHRDPVSVKIRAATSD